MLSAVAARMAIGLTIAARATTSTSAGRNFMFALLVEGRRRRAKDFCWNTVEGSENSHGLPAVNLGASGAAGMALEGFLHPEKDIVLAVFAPPVVHRDVGVGAL